MDVAGLFGNPRAVSHWDAFHAFLSREHRFAPRAVLEGMSRGGLIVFNWASKNPDKVAAIYADAPVCAIRSWPGGKGTGKGHEPSWQACLAAHGISEDESVSFAGDPLDRLAPLAEADIPVLLVCGEADQVVPVAENAHVLRKRYAELGGAVEYIGKAGVGHHPHSLADPKPIVDFLLSHTREWRVRSTPQAHDYFTLRGGLSRSLARFARGGRARVAFLGGSITKMDGWRRLTGEALQRRYPQTEFDFVDAGIPSTGSTPGAFRLQRDVFGRGALELLFVEAAVNDSTNGRDAREMLRGMEGVVRQARLTSPEIDIVLLHFVDPDKRTQIQAGETPLVIERHERVAEHYGIPSIDLAREVTERIATGQFSWKRDFVDLHPSAFGQRLYTASIERLLDAAEHAAKASEERTLPPALDPKSYFRARLVALSEANLGTGWTLDPSWKPSRASGTRPGFVNVPMLVSQTPGATLELPFHGTAVGIFVAAGHDAGTIEYTLDGKEFGSLDLYTRWSAGLHLPWLYVLAADLEAGEHRLSLGISKERNERSDGHAARIVHFAVNAGD